MRPIAPRTGAEEITIAEDEPDFLTATVAVYPEQGVYLLRWSPNEAERAMIAAGADIFVSMLGRVVPHKVMVTPEDWMVKQARAGGA